MINAIDDLKQARPFRVTSAVFLGLGLAAGGSATSGMGLNEQQPYIHIVRTNELSTPASEYFLQSELTDVPTGGLNPGIQIEGPDILVKKAMGHMKAMGFLSINKDDEQIIDDFMATITSSDTTMSLSRKV